MNTATTVGIISAVWAFIGIILPILIQFLMWKSPNKGLKNLYTAMILYLTTQQKDHPDLSHPDSCMLLFVLDLSLPVSAESIDRPTTGDRPHQDDTDGMAQRLIATMPTWWFTLTEMDYSFEGGKDYSHSQSHEKDKNCFSMCS